MEISKNSENIKKSSEKIKEMTDLSNLQVFQQVYDFYSRFPEKTNENQVLNDMIRHLKGIL